MANIWRSRWELVAQDTAPESLLNQLAELHIDFFGAQPLDEVTLTFEVPYREIKRVRQILESRGSDLRVCRPKGFRPRILQLSRRQMLIVCVFVWAVLLAVSNLFVWRVEVSGNETIPTGAVLRAMEESGAGIGSFWPGFDSEQLKTNLLLKLEDAQWIGLNYNSGVVYVSLRERRKIPEVIDNDEPIHIVAEKAGLITSISAKQGQSKVAVHDTVEEGQLLISGAAESTIGTTRTVHALGEVQARTWYRMTAKQPSTQTMKRYTGRRSMKISIIFGRNRLNFYPDSSISGDTCDTITMDYHLCIEGVFALPLRIVVQQYVYWTPVERSLNVQVQEEAAQQALMEALKQQLGEDGTVTSTSFAVLPRDEGMVVTLAAECLEEIGTEQPLTAEELQKIQMDNTLGDETTND
ncbi:MAG: sporulation protein YqfD [Oscillospiraceae bacterium]|nr:sporulation protein YqfD [Oscillospiraceae bacterium]